MNNINTDQRIVNRVLWLFVFAVLIHFAFVARGAEEKFEVLKTRTETYKNVTITKKTQEWVFILHAGGMVNIRIADLPADARRRLGYEASANGEFEQVATDVAETSASSTDTAPVETPAAGAPFLQQMMDSVRSGPSSLLSNPSSRYTLLAIVGLGYLFFCFCCQLICRKTHISPGILVWVPVLQLIPLLRAANMSPLWFVAFFVPVINIIAQIVWCFKITQERGKGFFVAILLILPVTNLFAFMYLAFSNEAPVDAKMASSPMLTLETA